MAKKQLIRLTEGDLHRIIKESVKQILKEGKVVNHKPLFYDKFGNPIQPGQYSGEIDRYPSDEFKNRYWQIRGFKNRKDAYNQLSKDDDGFDKYFDIQHHEIPDAIKKHDERRFKYDTYYDNGKYGYWSPFHSKSYAIPNYDREAELRRYKEKRRQRN